jgi:poly-gamma-glutamate capsule biosynthesis protein CapA/YwtB (metallophosphatase superfamily)
MRLGILFVLLSLMAMAQTQKDTLTIIGVGDIMMGSNYPTPAGLPPNNGRQLMQAVNGILADADLTIGNLEGVLLDDGGTPKTCRDPKVCYVFRSPEVFVENLTAAGFDIMCLANNHAGDFGEIGRKSSMRTLEKAGLAHAGQLNQPYTVVERNGVRYGFCGFAPNSNCVPLNDWTNARALVKKLDSLVDVVIVGFHGGAEGPQYQHVPRKEEIFHGENRGNVHGFAHAMVDAGADVVFGHGPHVTRAIEVYNDRFIAYSLGNFCTYGGINVSGVNGLAPIVKVFTNRTGRFLKAHITATRQQPRGNVEIDPQKLVIQRIKTLTREDFPELKLEIREDGWVYSSTSTR